MLLSGVFVLLAIGACLAALMALALITHQAMGSSETVSRDGLSRGSIAPSWSLVDQDGEVICSPAADGMQVILFADHSLKRFPSVASGLRALSESPDGPQVVMLLRVSGVVACDYALDALASLGLAGLPIVGGSPSLYWRYNVRVMPFVIFVDSAGWVRASSLVNHGWQVARLWKVASMPLAPGEAERPKRLSRILLRLGV